MTTFDGIVIGSGPNGLVTAAYLARAGLRIAVVERNPSPGGGASTAELTLPGFRHNVHSNFHAIGAGPVVRDLELERHGLRYLYPEVQHTFVFSDATAICLYADPERTAASIAAFSPDDARRYREVHERFGSGPMGAFLRRSLFRPPLTDGQLTALLRGPVGGEYLDYRSLSLHDAVDQTFEHDRVRAIFKLHCHASAYENAPGTGHFFLRVVARSGWSGLAIGGSAALSRSLISVIEECGGSVLTGRAVRRVDVVGGRAIGVELDDGDRLRADRFVASSLDPVTNLELAGEDAFGREVAEAIQGYRWARWSVTTLHLALAEPPSYRAAEANPDVGRAYGVYLGADASTDLVDSFAAIERGELPERFSGNGACNTLFDPSQAPEGSHAAFWWPFAPYALADGGPGSWDRRAGEIGDRILREWSGYAPNLARSGVVLGRRLFTPLDLVRHIPNMVEGSHHGGAYVTGQIDADRPVPQLANYRTPIAGLYLCGASSHPGGSINGAPGYNAANAIAEDVGIERWWTPVDAPGPTG